MKTCKECGEDRETRQLVHKELCNTCYRIKKREESVLKTDKTCAECSSVSSTKWYKGPTCRKCYRKIKGERLKENNLELYRNKRIKNNLRSRISKIVSGVVKQGSAVKDLGCSIEEFKKHLETKFVEGMSWDNYGHKTWHIDHIKPLNAFDLTKEEELKEACHYTNLQPLWAKDNLMKSDKYED